MISGRGERGARSEERGARSEERGHQGKKVAERGWLRVDSPVVQERRGECGEWGREGESFENVRDLEELEANAKLGEAQNATAVKRRRKLLNNIGKQTHPHGFAPIFFRGL